MPWKAGRSLLLGKQVQNGLPNLFCLNALESGPVIVTVCMKEVEGTGYVCLNALESGPVIVTLRS